MNWQSLAPIIGKFAPTVGLMLGGPFGEMAGNIVAGVLGVDSSPEAVSAAVSAASPDTLGTKLQAAEAEAAAKWPALAQIAQAQATEMTSVNQAIIAETAKGDGWLGRWRGIHAWELTLECPCFAGTLLWSIVSGNAVAINGFLSLSGLLMTYMGARFAVLGVHVWQGSNERQLALGGSSTNGGGGVVGTIGRIFKR